MRKNPILLTLLSVFVLLAFSCKKSKSELEFFFKANINGKEVSFNNIECQLGPDLGTPDYINFVLSADNGKDLFSIVIQKQGDITTGQYDSDNPDYLVEVNYITNYTSTSSVNYGLGSSSGSLPDSKFTITLSSITNDKVTGSFTGNYLYTSSGAEVHAGSGQFSSKRVQ